MTGEIPITDDEIDRMQGVVDAARRYLAARRYQGDALAELEVAVKEYLDADKQEAED